MGDTVLTRNPVAQAWLGTIITIGFFLATFLPMILRDPSIQVDEALKQTLQNMFILVIGYYFGSSQGSAKKDEVIATQATAATTAAAQSVTNSQTPAITPTVKIDDTKPVQVQEAK